MKFKTFIKKPWFLICVSAVLSALPYTFDFAFLLSWVSFVPLFYLILTNPPQKLKSAIKQGFLFGLLYHICIYYWFIWFYPLDYANLGALASIAVVALAWLGISAIHGILWCLPFVLCFFVRKKIKKPIVLAAVALLGIMLAQKATSVSELAFPWVRISLGQYRATALIQSASLFGIDGVDMLILAVNAFAALAIIYPIKKRRLATIAVASVFSVNLAFGLIRLNINPDYSESINILTVQGSISKEEKWAIGGNEYCFRTYSKLTTENVTDDTDLVLWPESAVPTEYRTEKGLKRYKNLSNEIGKPIIAGILKSEGGVYTNNTLLIDGDNLGTPYSKRILVPFGEYMPYRNVLARILPFLENINVLSVDYTAGTDSALTELNGKKIGSIICFESIYPRLARESALDGAELLIEATNDSWLEDSPAMKQHLAHGVFRSVENSRYLVRSANSGISATVDSRGRIISELGAMEKGVISDTVYFDNSKTLYTLTGDIIFPIYSVAVVLWCIYLTIKNKNELS